MKASRSGGQAGSNGSLPVVALWQIQPTLFLPVEPRLPFPIDLHFLKAYVCLVSGIHHYFVLDDLTSGGPLHIYFWMQSSVTTPDELSRPQFQKHSEDSRESSMDNSSFLVPTITTSPILCPYSFLPNDVWVHVLSYVSFSDSLICRTVSTDFRQFANDALEQRGMEALSDKPLPFNTRKLCPHAEETDTIRFSKGWNESFRTKEGMFDIVKEFFNTLGPSMDPPNMFRNDGTFLASYLRTNVSKLSIHEEIEFGQRYYSFETNPQDANPTRARAMALVASYFSLHKATKEAIFGVLLSVDAEIQMATIACRHEYDDARHSALNDRNEHAILFVTAKGIPLQVTCLVEKKGYWDWNVLQE